VTFESRMQTVYIMLTQRGRVALLVGSCLTRSVSMSDQPQTGQQVDGANFVRTAVAVSVGFKVTSSVSSGR
jgi:hypothetical protein